MRTSPLRSALPLVAALVATLVAPLAALGCSKSESSAGSGGPPASPSVSVAAAPASAPAAAASAAGSATPIARAGAHGPGRGGVDAMFFRAADDLPLTDELRARVDALQAGLFDRDSAPKDAMAAFNKELGGQVRAGKIEPAKLQAGEQAFDASMKGAHDKQAKALDGLHALLDAGQRKAVVDAVRAHWEARESRSHAGAAPDGGAPDWTKRRVERMTRELSLEPAQQTQLAAAMAKQTTTSMQAMRETTKAQLDTLLTAFQADAFDASQAVPVGMGVKAPHELLDRRVTFLTAFVPVLHPDQRDKLATSIELGHFGGPGGSPDEEEEGRGAPGGSAGGGGGSSP